MEYKLILEQNMKAMEIMHANPIFVKGSDTLRDVIDKMYLYQLSMLPVVASDMTVIGVIAENDIKQAFVSRIQFSETATDKYLMEMLKLGPMLAEKEVQEFMKKEPITLDWQEPAIKAAEIIIDNKIKFLPVTSEGKLMGIISRVDIYQAVFEGAF